jgi:hypothetical protein
MRGLATRKRGPTLRFQRRHSTAINETARSNGIPGYPNLRRGWPKGVSHPSRGRPVSWKPGEWGDFSDLRTPLSRLAAKIEKELRHRYRIARDDRVLGMVAHQAGRQCALAEKLAEDMLTGEMAAQRHTQERWAAATRNYRLALDLLADAAGHPRREPGPSLQDVRKRYEPPSS